MPKNGLVVEGQFSFNNKCVIPHPFNYFAFYLPENQGWKA
jgi:hypothetical protein